MLAGGLLSLYLVPVVIMRVGGGGGGAEKERKKERRKKKRVGIAGKKRISRKRYRPAQLR